MQPFSVIFLSQDRGVVVKILSREFALVFVFGVKQWATGLEVACQSPGQCCRGMSDVAGRGLELTISIWAIIFIYHVSSFQELAFGSFLALDDFRGQF